MLRNDTEFNRNFEASQSLRTYKCTYVSLSVCVCVCVCVCVLSMYVCALYMCVCI